MNGRVVDGDHEVERGELRGERVQVPAGIDLVVIHDIDAELFPRSGELREIFAAAPVDRILVETDAPYLAPPPHRGKRNEPAFTLHTAQVGAEVFGMGWPEFAAQTQANFDRLFWKVARYQEASE